MNEASLCRTIDTMVSNCVSSQDKFITRQERLLSDYQAMPYGDEEDGQSSIVTTEVSDTVDANMVSLARIFQGAGDPVEFIPTSQTDEAVKEARQKQAYTSYVIRNCEDSFVTIHGALKSAQIYDYAAIEYGIETKKEAEFHRKTGLDLDEITGVIEEFEEKDGIISVEVSSKDEVEKGRYDIEFRLVRETKEYFITNVPVDDFLITANVPTKNKASLIGKRFTKTRGELLAEGFRMDKIAALVSDDGHSNIDYITFADQGGDVLEGKEKEFDNWAAEKVTGVDVFVTLYNKKNIKELRHVVKVGDNILEDSPADHINYAYGSSILMPNNSTGKGAAQASQSSQRVSTVVTRQVLDNLYSVNHPRTVIRYKDQGGGVSMDDMLDIQLDGVVRTDGEPQRDVMPLVTPFIGDKALMVLAYLDSANTKATGSTMANQALQADNLNEETATRFNGVQDAAMGKIELQARVLGETLITQLYEGIAWIASRYQDTELEIEVLGEPMTISPTDWKFGHKIRTTIGTGASDNEKTMQSLIGILQLQNSERDRDSTLVDESDIYNTLVKITKQANQHAPQEFWNNPAQSNQVWQATAEIQQKQLAQLSQQLEANNPLIAMEQVKANAKQQGDQLKGEIQMQQLLVKMQQDQAQMQSDNQKFMAELRQEREQFFAKETREWAELEIENNVNIEGQGQNG